MPPQAALRPAFLGRFRVVMAAVSKFLMLSTVGTKHTKILARPTASPYYWIQAIPLSILLAMIMVRLS
jgi:hypothetical protein